LTFEFFPIEKKTVYIVGDIVISRLNAMKVCLLCGCRCQQPRGVKETSSAPPSELPRTTSAYMHWLTTLTILVYILYAVSGHRHLF